MKAIAHQAFLHDQLGSVPAGEFEVTAEQAASLRIYDFIEIHDAKPATAALIETKPEPAAKGKSRK